MTAVLLLLAIVAVMWLGQTALLRVARMPVRWKLGVHDAPEWVRVGCRTVTQAGIVAAIALYPAIRGERFLAYFGAIIPMDDRARLALVGFLAATLFLSLLYLAWDLADCVRFAVRRAPRRIVRRLVMLPLSAALGAGLEELLFRGVLLRGLLQDVAAPAAVAVGACAFAAAHYLRDVKRYWTFPGHLALGACLCIAFLWTGNLWLSFGLHAGGIVGIMAARPFVRYEGPAWVTGASIFPFAGVVGVVALAVLTAMLGWLVRP